MTEDRRQDLRRDEDRTFPWQVLANILFAALITLGGYVWSGTVQRVQTLETTVSSRGERIAVLEVRSTQQDESIRVLRDQLQRMNDKLDQLLRQSR